MHAFFFMLIGVLLPLCTSLCSSHLPCPLTHPKAGSSQREPTITILWFLSCTLYLSGFKPHDAPHFYREPVKT